MKSESGIMCEYGYKGCRDCLHYKTCELRHNKSRKKQSKRKYRKWTSIEEERLLAMYLQGEPIKTIAEEMGVTVGNVNSKITILRKAHGIPKRKIVRQSAAERE